MATPTAARPAQRNCALGPELLGLNWGSSGPYRAANPDYQNCSFSAKMRIMSVLCGAILPLRAMFWYAPLAVMATPKGDKDK